MLAQFWNTTAAERTATHPADEIALAGAVHLVRAVDVQAPRATTFRWLCQLKVAPYSYDLIDNFGRRSPRHLTPGADNLAVGQSLIVGPVVAFEPNAFIAVRASAASAKAFGPFTMSYQVTEGVDAASRIVACIAIAAAGPLGNARLRALAVGDLAMMRKQLLTLKHLAEREAFSARATPRTAV